MTWDIEEAPRHYHRKQRIVISQFSLMLAALLWQASPFDIKRPLVKGDTPLKP